MRTSINPSKTFIAQMIVSGIINTLKPHSSKAKSKDKTKIRENIQIVPTTGSLKTRTIH